MDRQQWTGHSLTLSGTAVKRTDAYRNLVRRYGNGADSIDIKLNEKKKMRVFSWDKGEVDTLMSTMDSMRHYKKHLQTGFVSMDPHTGHIKAWVGGINHKHFKFDHVKQSKRQPGSTFKAFVYAAAIENGYSPCYTVIDQPVEINTPGQPTWSPKNADGKVLLRENDDPTRDGAVDQLYHCFYDEKAGTKSHRRNSPPPWYHL
jgi:penicillin-binding protein 1A